ncbi:centrosomal protein of 72 kDa [Genypterus blacodes]|uniref:centrosomal protein of 72 kDa n=1 Tax=Genypterus blacodes TaxID=154954 RepID=UPI003F774194
MAAGCLTTITEQWIRDRLHIKHPYLGDVRSLSLPGTYEEKIGHLGRALHNFVRLKSLDLSCNGLVSVEGVQNLKSLEQLILYYNCIPSIEEVKVLCELPALRELDLRLNPLTKGYPHYRQYLVNAMPNLRRLDGCSVRDTERKIAILQFSPEPQPKQKSSSVCRADQRSSDPRLASVQRLTKRLWFLNDTNDIVLNFVDVKHGDRDPKQEASKDVSEEESSSPKQAAGKSILRFPPSQSDNTKSKVPHTERPPHKERSLKITDGPKVSFDPYVEKHRLTHGKQKQREFPKKARGHFTPNPAQDHSHSSALVNIRPPSPRKPGLNLSDPSNPILHPPRLTYKTAEGSALPQQAEQKRRGSYRKPLEMLLNLVDKHWTGERSLHHNNNFLSQAVQILSMMENDICRREAEVRTLRRETDALKVHSAAREDKHKVEVGDLSAQLEEARCSVGQINEQLRIVLQENVALQKQLIKLERQHLKSMMERSPLSQIKEAQTEVEELRKEIEGLKEKVHEA